MYVQPFIFSQPFTSSSPSYHLLHNPHPSHANITKLPSPPPDPAPNLAAPLVSTRFTLVLALAALLVDVLTPASPLGVSIPEGEGMRVVLLEFGRG